VLLVVGLELGLQQLEVVLELLARGLEGRLVKTDDRGRDSFFDEGGRKIPASRGRCLRANGDCVAT
jgi:hypothetical protein